MTQQHEANQGATTALGLRLATFADLVAQTFAWRTPVIGLANICTEYLPASRERPTYCRRLETRRCVPYMQRTESHAS
ncbi:MAG TPA: hypothetical protein PKA58_16815 [Polyangium sp.]|nr:hypothetical protein [Polyangium sp.]